MPLLRPLVAVPRAAVLSLAVLIGWTIVDCSALATTGNAYLIPTLLPGYLVALVAAAIAGPIIALDTRVSLFALAALGILAIAPKLAGLNIAWHLTCLPRALFLLAGAFVLSGLIGRRAHHTIASAVALGVLAAALFTLVSTGTASGLTSLLVVGGSLIAASGYWSPVAHRIAVALILLLLTTVVTLMTQRSSRLLRPDHPPTDPAAVAPGTPNLIFIVLDTVSIRHLAPYGYARVTTPGLDEFVRTYAVRYTRARSVSSWTLPAHASLFTGLYPSEHGADHPRSSTPESVGGAAATALGVFPAEPLRADVPTLAEVLAAQGYQTAAIVANNGYLSHQFGIDRGFMHYDDRGGTALGSLLLPQIAGYQQHLRKGPRRADRITNLALAWLAQRDRRQPFFLFLNYMDAHGPYVPPTPYANDFEPTQPSDPIKYDRRLYPLQYDRELRYLDAHLTRFITALGQQGLMDDSVVAITADHGEGFGEHGFWRHDLALYDELIAVPLYVKAAGKPQPGVSDQAITSVGLHHLIMKLLGHPSETADTPVITAEWYRSAALNAAPEIRPDGNQSIDRDLLVWIDDNGKWTVASDGSVTLYDLASDPAERNPLPLTSQQANQARARASAWWQAHPPIVRNDHPGLELDDAVIDRLRNLGYVH